MVLVCLFIIFVCLFIGCLLVYWFCLLVIGFVYLFIGFVYLLLVWFTCLLVLFTCLLILCLVYLFIGFVCLYIDFVPCLLVLFVDEAVNSRSERYIDLESLFCNQASQLEVTSIPKPVFFFKQPGLKTELNWKIKCNLSGLCVILCYTLHM